MSGPRLGRAPAVLLVPAVVAVALLVVPLATLVLDTPWRTLPAHLVSDAVRDALLITGLTSLLTVVACEHFRLVGYGAVMPERVRQALVDGTGPFLPYLELVRAIEAESVFDYRERAE